MSRHNKILIAIGSACLLLGVAGSILLHVSDFNSFRTPVINSVMPSSVCANGKNDFSLMLSGTMFSTSSVVLWNGSPRPTRYVNPDQIQAWIGGREVASPGSVQVQVGNKAAMGRPSAPVVFRIVASCADTGPLHASNRNPRYFADSAGKIVYLTGSHTWSNFKNLGPTYRSRNSDFGRYLAFLQRYGHNFIRLWAGELTQYNCRGEGVQYATPFPWLRTGPGAALDGRKKFDLSRLDQAYFDRLRDRVLAAQARKFYVSIMLFNGYGLQFCQASLGGLPLLGENNINGVDAPGTSSHTLEYPDVTAIQEAYVRKVIDTVNDLDNVLYEISNESGSYSTAWQYHMINYIKHYEATKPKQHPVGMTFQYHDGHNSALFASPADWISPAGKEYKSDPPPATGAKVILIDTDHVFGIGGDRTWVWKCFTRGLNPIYMDEMSLTRHQGARKAMGETLEVAKKIDLLQMVPHGSLSSTHYCLANPGTEYLVYSPSGGSFAVDLRAALPSQAFSIEWLGPEGQVRDTRTSRNTRKVTGGSWRTFAAPFTGDSVLHLKRLPPSKE